MRNPPLPPQTPDNIRRRREAVGLTQAEAAALVYVTPRAWQRWESGDRAIPLATWELFLAKIGALKL